MRWDLDHLQEQARTAWERERHDDQEVPGPGKPVD